MSIELLIEEERKSIKQIEDVRTKAEKKIADSQKEAQKILDQAIKKEFIQKYLQKEEEKGAVRQTKPGRAGQGGPRWDRPLLGQGALDGVQSDESRRPSR